MDQYWQFALGVILTLTTGILANLLTPYVGPFWRRLRALQHKGHQSQLRQQIRVLQLDLDDHNRLSRSTHDLVVLLFQILIGVFAVFVVACTCAFIALSTDVSEHNRRELLKGALVLWILAVSLSAVFVVKSYYYTEAGAKKRRAALEAEIAKIFSKLAQSAPQE
jgi:hypothetical protein